MSRRPVDLVVISDVHLGTYGCHAEECLAYLRSVAPAALVLNGDIVDCWQFRKGYFPAAHLEVLRQVARFAARGVPVYYLTGNHDDVFRRFSDLRLGNVHLLDHLELVLGRERVLFFHGDAFDVSIRHARWLAKLGGKGYEFLILLNRWINRGLVRLGRPRISFSRRVKRSVKRAVRFIDDFEQAAVEWGLSRGVDTVVCGHIHQPRMTTLKGRKGASIRYLNSGDWVENLTALEYHRGHWRLWRHETDAPLAASGEDAAPTAEPAAAVEPEPAAEPLLAMLGEVASAQLLRERALRDAAFPPFPASRDHGSLPHA